MPKSLVLTVHDFSSMKPIDFHYGQHRLRHRTEALDSLEFRHAARLSICAREFTHSHPHSH